MEDDILGNDFGDFNLIGDPEFPYFFKMDDLLELERTVGNAVISHTRKKVGEKYDSYFFWLVKIYTQRLLTQMDLWLYLDWIQPDTIDKKELT